MAPITADINNIKQIVKEKNNSATPNPISYAYDAQNKISVTSKENKKQGHYSKTET